jgi:hypothetical protein
MKEQKDLPAWQFAIIFFAILFLTQLLEKW